MMQVDEFRKIGIGEALREYGSAPYPRDYAECLHQLTLERGETERLRELLRVSNNEYQEVARRKISLETRVRQLDTRLSEAQPDRSKLESDRLSLLLEKQRLSDDREKLDDERRRLNMESITFHTMKHANQREERRVESARLAAIKKKERVAREERAKAIDEALKRQRAELELEFKRRLTAEIETAVAEQLNAARLAAEVRLLEQEATNVVNAVVDGEIDSRIVRRVERVRSAARTFDGTDAAARSEHTQCVVCHANEVCVLYEPCAHIVTCIDCTPRHLLLCDGARCPKCRAPVESFKRVYLGD